jgi:hypothetical protein
MGKATTIEQVREAVKSTVEHVIAAYKDEPDTNRETIIDRLDEEADTLFGQLVYMGRIAQWDVDVLTNHAADCGAIIEAAKWDAWVEDDNGLWEGMTYGVLGAVAFYSLRNLLYQAMKDAAHDTNDDFPFAKEEADEDE